MPEDTVVAPEVSTGLAPQEGASQEASSGAQAQSETQTDTHTQVERNDSRLASGEEPRPFERMAGRKFDKLEKAIRNLTDLVSQSRTAPGSPQSQTRTPYKPTAEDWKNPEVVFNKMLDDRLQDVMEKIPETIQQRDQAATFQRSQQEARKMIETNEALKRDPEGIERIKDILQDDEFGLDKMSTYYPLEAAKAAMEIYKARYGSTKTSAAPQKAQMISTATGVNTGAGKSTVDAEVAQMYKEIATMPERMNDPTFQAKLADLVKRSKVEDRMKGAS